MTRDPSSRTREADKSWYARYIKPQENVYRDFWLLAISVVVVLTVAQAQRTNDRAHRTSIEAAHVATQAKNLALQFQRNRVVTIRTTCERDNARNRATIRELRRFDSPSRQRKQLVAFFEAVGIHVTSRQANVLAALQTQNIGGTIALIDALAPTQDCAAAVARAEGRRIRQNPVSIPPIEPILPPRRR